MNININKGISLIEYVTLFLIVIGAFIVMQNVLQHRIYGSWAKAGQSFAYGRQYDPQKTTECGFDDTVNQWYDLRCYQTYINQNQCNGDFNCQENAVMNCTAAWCNQLNNGATL